MLRVGQTWLVCCGVVCMTLCFGCKFDETKFEDAEVNDTADEFEDLFPGDTVNVDVMAIDGLYYPVAAFRCAQPEEPDEATEACPEGSGCDELHWHGSGIAAIAVDPDDAATVVQDLSFVEILGMTVDDPDTCHCGYGKLSELPVVTIQILESDVVTYMSTGILVDFFEPCE